MGFGVWPVQAHMITHRLSEVNLHPQFSDVDALEVSGQCCQDLHQRGVRIDELPMLGRQLVDGPVDRLHILHDIGHFAGTLGIELQLLLGGLGLDSQVLKM